MKFGKQFEEYEQPEWRGHYIPYKTLKKDLEAMKGINPSPDVSPVCTPKKGVQEWPPSPTGGAQWLQWVEREAVRVGEFIDRGLNGLEAQLEDLSQMSNQHDSELPVVDEESSFMELRLLEALGKVADGLLRLRGFAELNHAALYKILKKHDKVLSSKEGLGDLFPRLVKETRLADTVRMDLLDAELKRLSLKNSKMEGLDASPEVARLAAGFGHTKSVKHSRRFAASNLHELMFAFFLGSSAALFFSIGVIMSSPTKSPRSFSTADFLTPIPVFRAVFSLLLILWCMGAVTMVCSACSINHIFILKIDPRWHVGPEFFFSRAATLTTLWILIFGMYVVDYKWEVVPAMWASAGYNKRSSFHFVLYPISLLALAFSGLVWPSRICRNRFKFAALRSIKRTMLSPLYPVDFADNIMGDILTSIAKPLQDVPYAVCYLATSHPLSEDLVLQFHREGHTCSASTHDMIMPLIAGLPYVFRAMQCLRRYSDTSETRHLWNFGKYTTCLLVVVVSNTGSPMTIGIVSAFATIYAGFWDVAIDWALGSREFWPTPMSLKRPSKIETDLARDADGNVMVKPVRAEDPERLFPSRVYWVCSLLDIAARFTWVLTLVPIKIVTHSIVLQAALVSFISSVEIMRRSMWAVLRIESEQITNSSGFRALLWVPSKLNAAEAFPAAPRAGGQDGLRQPLLEP
mmetsp:Transcript_42835/g.121214  ORF Transcript_42835/g.121214 Transcript_42835/m.121214 type:complete len:689 (-) Transcript_42835:33-2099(-)